MRLLLFSVLLLAASVSPSLAQGTVSAQGVYTSIIEPALLTVVTAVVPIITAYAVAWFRKKLDIQGLELDEKHRDALDTAITNAAGSALNQLGNTLAGKTIDVRNPAVLAAVDYVVKSAPEALDHFDLTGKSSEIAQKIVAKLPQVANN